MPEISRFYGVVIRMYPNDHQPPHFYAVYGDDLASIDIRSGEMTDGELPPRAFRFVSEWLEMHRIELLEIWDSCKFKKIPPLY